MMRNSHKRLTPLEYNVLTRIDWRGETTIIELARFFEIDKSDLYKIIKKLKSLGYIDDTKEKPNKYYSLRNNGN